MNIYSALVCAIKYCKMQKYEILISILILIHRRRYLLLLLLLLPFFYSILEILEQKHEVPAPQVQIEQIPNTNTQPTTNQNTIQVFLILIVILLFCYYIAIMKILWPDFLALHTYHTTNKRQTHKRNKIEN